jgi:hypothetical protein
LGLALDSLLASADCGKYSHFVEEKTGAWWRPLDILSPKVSTKLKTLPYYYVLDLSLIPAIPILLFSDIIKFSSEILERKP